MPYPAEGYEEYEEYEGCEEEFGGYQMEDDQNEPILDDRIGAMPRGRSLSRSPSLERLPHPLQQAQARAPSLSRSSTSSSSGSGRMPMHRQPPRHSPPPIPMNQKPLPRQNHPSRPAPPPPSHNPVQRSRPLAGVPTNIPQGRRAPPGARAPPPHGLHGMSERERVMAADALEDVEEEIHKIPPEMRAFLGERTGMKF
ncbi:hypothetical protein BT69DRAFT_1283388 [Atractiella rhizophila]|nr:hypothetical protein BT69DRAFT_1283388 [Atractiella rhizophila]